MFGNKKSFVDITVLTEDTTAAEKMFELTLDDLLPKPVSLEKVEEKKELVVKFWCEVTGVSNGWYFEIKSNLPKQNEYSHWNGRDNCAVYRAVVHDLSEYGTHKWVYEYPSWSVETVQQQAQKFLSTFRKSYERCQVKFTVEE